VLRLGIGAAVSAALLGTGCSTTRPGQITSRRVKSAAVDGVELAVYESGNPKGRPVVLVHGFAQSHESWVKQMNSASLQKQLRLIAFDLRGHGHSGKPMTKDAYHDARRWAADLRTVIEATGAEKPSIVAWSYGGRVLNDYLGVYGDADLGALNYVAATSTGERFGLGRSYALLGPMLSDDAAVASRATEAFLRACFEKQPTESEFEDMKRFNAQTPVAVRKLLAGRPAAYDDVLRKLKVRVLVTHGETDQISSVAMSEYTSRLVPNSALSLYPGVGHSPFFEMPDRFNKELLELVSAG
jgi:pimeloyl-ACP methyl ester carboxylesterase